MKGGQRQPFERLRWHRGWFALGVLTMLAILWAAVHPDPDIALGIPQGDKWLHALTFAGLTGWWGNLYRSWRARGYAALACLAFGVFIEIAQNMTPARNADVADVLADGIGIVLGGMLLRTPLARVLAGLEAWSVRRRGH